MHWHPDIAVRVPVPVSVPVARAPAATRHPGLPGHPVGLAPTQAPRILKAIGVARADSGSAAALLTARHPTRAIFPASPPLAGPDTAPPHLAPHPAAHDIGAAGAVVRVRPAFACGVLHPLGGLRSAVWRFCSTFQPFHLEFCVCVWASVCAVCRARPAPRGGGAHGARRLLPAPSPTARMHIHVYRRATLHCRLHGDDRNALTFSNAPTDQAAYTNYRPMTY